MVFTVGSAPDEGEFWVEKFAIIAAENANRIDFVGA
jgi:hypothetical protein